MLQHDSCIEFVWYLPNFGFNFSMSSHWMRSVVLLSGFPSWWHTATYWSGCTRRLGFTRTINSWKKCHVVSRSSFILRGILWCLIRRGSILLMKTNWHGMILPFFNQLFVVHLNTWQNAFLNWLLYTWTLDRMPFLTDLYTWILDRMPFLTNYFMDTWTLERISFLTDCCTPEHLTECLFKLTVVHLNTWQNAFLNWLLYTWTLDGTPFLTNCFMDTWTLERMSFLTDCCTPEHLTECLS
jgi:hypothetical protein